MGFVNRKRKANTRAKAEKGDGHLNWMGGISHRISQPLWNLRLAASTCFFGEPMYYHEDPKGERPKRPGRHQRSQLTSAQRDYLRATLQAVEPLDWRELSPAELMERAIDAALDSDFEGTLKEAVRLRTDVHIRTTPQVILVRAANHAAAKGNELVGQYAREIIQRADEPAVCLAYQMESYKDKPIPTRLKRALARSLEHFDEFQLAKYRMENAGVKTVDVVNLVHPRSDAVGKLTRGELKTTDKTWESIISEKGSTPAAWQQALDVMGHMALLRNLRNLLEKSQIDPALFASRLKAGAANGKQLPFRYYSAYLAVKGLAPAVILDAIEEAMMISLANLPRFEGRVMSLCDNSGSAQGTTTSSMGSTTVATIGNLTGLLTGLCADDGMLGIFGDRLETFPVRKRSSILEQLDKANQIARTIGNSTENGVWLFWDAAIRQRQKWDHIFIYSDMQCGHGGLYGTNPTAYDEFRWGGGQHIDVPKLISKYRREVNPNVLVYLVQIAGYQDTIMPEFYDRTFILGGWGEGILRFARSMEEMAGARN